MLMRENPTPGGHTPPEQIELPLFNNEIANPPSVTDEDAATLLGLSRINGVGFRTIRALFEIFRGRLSNVWEIRLSELEQYLRMARSPDPATIANNILKDAKRLSSWGLEQMAFLERQDVSLLLRGTPAYPRRLLELDDPPAWLFVEGDSQLLHDAATVAVVGTRAPTLEGVEAARVLSVQLAAGKCIIVSGLAEGIDAIGHQTAVDYGVPTIAVLGHGIEVIFPVGTAGLRRTIVERGGALVSEYLPRDSYARENFVQRNRVQAALATMVGIVEGRSRSGTAHTLRFAQQLHRPTFGVHYGSLRHVPETELLHELASLGQPVFNVAETLDIAALRAYLAQSLPVEQRRQRPGHPSPVSGLLSEIDRLVSAYHISDSDLDWLLHQIRQRRAIQKGQVPDAT